MEPALPAIPAKRYFTIGEVSELCGVKPHVLRYWEQEFTQLRPMKRRGNRRYYQHHEVLLVRRIRELLYEKRFTISGARDRLAESQIRSGSAGDADASVGYESVAPSAETRMMGLSPDGADAFSTAAAGTTSATRLPPLDFDLRRELLAIRRLLSD